MKANRTAIHLLFLLTCLASCSGNNPISEATSAPVSEPAPSSEPILSSEVNPYQGRIKSVDMTILDLTGCIASANDPRYFDEPKPLDFYRRKEKLKLHYLDQIDDVYFISLDSYASIFQNELAEGLTSTCVEEDGVATWTLSKGGKETYKLSLDAKKQTMSVLGGIDESFVKPIYAGKTGLSDYCQSSEEYLEKYPNKIRTYSFAKYGFDFFEVDGKYRYPFALLAAETSKAIDRSFLYLSAYQEIIEYGVKEQLDEATFQIDGREVRADSYYSDAFVRQYRASAEDATRVAPATLTAFNKKLFYFIMDNYYGLAKERNIKSMSDYFENFAESEAFLSTDGRIRGSAYAKAISMLNDLHTSYSYSSIPFSEMPMAGAAVYSQTLNNERSSLSTILTCLREEEIQKYNAAHNLSLSADDLRYSSDGKYAYFSFDGFNTYNYYGEGEVPEDKRLADTYYLFVKNLSEAKAKGAKNVIIDISTNGGGYVGIMGKLLALMSKNNHSEMFLRADDTGSIQKIVTSVDSNRDGVYDANDCFGNDLTFYLVTSNYSFSCGNAFPFYAQQYGFAKTIGLKSGGGECCVFSYSLPTGQGLTYSSPYHLGYYDAEHDTYKGDEAGAYPNLSLTNAFYHIYDVNAVGEHIDRYLEGQSQISGS